MRNPDTVTILRRNHPMQKLAEDLHRTACAKYNSCYSLALFIAATENKSEALCRRLVDDALALCASPYYRLSRHHWDEPAQEFLRQFVQLEGADGN